ncbi:MAG: hypothetical protein ACRDNT_16410 [Streptosporangiaceae bacterium]
MGLDRMLMLIKGIPDIRLLRSADPRIADQMADLARCQRVPSMPPITCDLSVAVAHDEDEETLGDRVRDALGSDALGSDALGSDAQCVEEVRALSATDCDRLPVSAARRLGAKLGQAGPSGAKRGQKNLLVRVVLRDLEKTLTNEAANALRDRIHLAIHQGTEYQWAHQAAQPGAA